MEGSKQKVMAMAGVCALLVLSFMAADVNAACSVNQLSACTAAVTGGTPPTPACCAQVAAIQDFNCFCNILQTQGAKVPPKYITNAVNVPSKCGAQGQSLRNKQCGNVRIP